MPREPQKKDRAVCPWVHLLIGGCLTTVLTLHLSGSNFGLLLSSDHLYPHIFVKDWLFGDYPLDAWKFGSATFLFPDYPIYGLLLVILGDSGVTFPVFAVINMLLLGAAFGLAFSRFGGIRSVVAFALGYDLLGLVLALQFVPFHELSLYWLLLPGFHGSTEIVGLFLCIVLIDGYCRQHLFATGPKALLVVVGALGVYSNVLLFTQFLVPWVLTMVVLNSSAEADRSRIVWQQIRLVLSMLAGALVLRFALMAMNIWDYGSVFRHFPYPSAVWLCFRDFVSDLGGETGHRLWVFLGLYVLLVPVTVIGLGSRFRRQPTTGWQVFGLFVILSVLAGLVLPVISLYWEGFVSSRYFLNLLILPALALGVFTASVDAIRLRLIRWPGLIVATLGAAVVVSLFASRPLPPGWHHFETPDRVAEFDQMVVEHRLSLGLSGYWYSHLYNELGNGNAFLNHVRTDGTPHFWCNNVYWYYGRHRQEDGAALRFPDYDFVLTNDLDESAIRLRYGEPLDIVKGEHNTIFIYKDRSQQIRSALEPEIIAWLDGKSLEISRD